MKIQQKTKQKKGRMEFQTFIKMQCMYSMNRCHFQCYGSLSSHIPFFPAFSFVIQALFSKMQSSRSLHFLVILKSTESMGYFRKEMNFLLIVHFRHFCSSYYFLCFFFCTQNSVCKNDLNALIFVFRSVRWMFRFVHVIRT